MKAAAQRAIESSERLRRKAIELCEGLDQIPRPSNGVPTTGLSEEDSMVIAVERVIQTAKR